MRCTVLALALIFLSGCGGGSGDGGGGGDAVVWARSADSSTLDPAAVEWGEDAKVTQNIFQTLVRFGEDSVDLVPGLATEWAFSEDGKTLTFQLRKGVTFHDGTTFEADDVVFTFGRLLDKNHEYKPKVAPYAPMFSNIAAVKADGTHVVVFTLKKKSAVILYQIALFGAGIVSPDAVKKHGDKFPANPVGTGPFKFVRWERDVKIVLERFEGYWGKKPGVRRVLVVPVQNPQTGLQKLEQGAVHIVDNPTLADIKPLQDNKATGVDFEGSLNVLYLGFNMKRHPYSDINFRKAVALALDRKTLNDLAYYGLAEPSSNIVPPSIWGDIGKTDPYEYNIEKAKEYLAKVKLDSKEVELIHMTFSRPYVPEPHRVAAFIKDQLRKIGLEVKLAGYDQSAYTPLTKTDDHPMYLLGWNADYPDPDNFMYPLLHGDNAGDLNGSHFNDPEFNEAVTRAQSELDGDKRKALYRKAYARYRELMPTVPLVHVKQLVAKSARIDFNLHPIEYRFISARFRK